MNTLEQASIQNIGDLQMALLQNDFNLDHYLLEGEPSYCNYNNYLNINNYLNRSFSINDGYGNHQYSECALQKLTIYFQYSNYKTMAL